MIRTLLSFACATVFLAPSSAAEPHRRLIISTPTLQDEAYRTQAAELLAQWAGLVERDFVVETRRNASGFSVVLIGKDGGEKLRRNTLLSSKELFAIVDAMPMRRAEREKRR